MKRTLIVILALTVSLGLTAAAQAQSAPKTICAQFTSNPDLKLVMALKQAGKVKLAPGPTKFYTIVGEYFVGAQVPFSGPLTGTGHLKGSDLHFNFTSHYTIGGQLYIYEAEGVWHLATATGSITRKEIYNSIGSPASFDIQAADCSGLTLPRGASDLNSAAPEVLAILTGRGGN